MLPKLRGAFFVRLQETEPRSFMNRRALLIRVVITVLVLCVGLPAVWVTGSLAPAAAANALSFRPGLIVSDANFYNGNALSAAEVQAVLNNKGSGCRTDCLKNYSTVSVAKPAQAGLCDGMQGGLRLSAAEVIDRVARSCGISQKALIVMLQKEQGLITIDAPSEYRYRAAMGQGCPDTAACDVAYYGFFNQVYGAARQLKVYGLYPASFNYREGRWNTILHHPTTSCGTKQVYIENKATAALYIYTPYTPNDAALRAQWAEGDGCSSYGNRNFFMYWSAWFGDPLVAGAAIEIPALRALYPSLGAETSGLVCGLVAGACKQEFVGGLIFWTPESGATKIDGGILGLWNASGGAYGYLGYPRDTAAWSTAGGGGWIQQFANGQAQWSTAAGGRLVSSSIHQRYAELGGHPGALGWALTDQRSAPSGGVEQLFERGAIYWSAPGGTHAVTGGIGETFDSAGGLSSFIGYPMSDAEERTHNGGGWAQAFQGAAIYWRFGAGYVMYGGIRDEYTRHGWSAGTLGWPVSAQDCGLSPTGCMQSFQNGIIAWSPSTPATRVDGAVLATYRAEGSHAGRLGYPTGSARASTVAGGGTAQSFAGGGIFARTGSQAYSTWGGIGIEFAAQGAESGPLRWPVGSQQCDLVGGGCRQNFQNGALVWSPVTGTVSVEGAVLAAYDRSGGVAGPAGYPTAAAAVRLGNGTGVVQTFQNGVVYASPATGAYLLRGPIRDAYVQAGYNQGSFGWPTSDLDCTLAGGGCQQQFQGDWIVWSTDTGTVRIGGELWATWKSSGAEGGSLGYPTGAVTPRVGGGWTQPFQGGRLSWTAARGGFIDN